MRSGGIRPVLLPVLFTLGLYGCSERGRSARQGNADWFRAMPDERPQMLNVDVPFRYPLSLYQQKVQGNVLLRLFLTLDGQVVPDSTRIIEPSGHPELDAAALAGAARLQFRAARLRGTPIPVSLLFPVHFRHPEGPTLPGDSL